ncbi:MAG: hypothetical protein GYA50_09465 [Eubacteriaceae bacterium]|nr:hypothetical protein [Eubacteriaceae bacterium]
MKSSDEAAGVGKKVVKSGDEVSEAVEKTNKAAIKIEQSSTGNNKILWDSWQNYDKVTVNDRIYAKVGNRLYSEHAVNRMQPSGNRFGPNIYQGLNGKDYGRSVAPQFVEDVINSSKPILQQNGNLAYISGTVKVITNPQGMVVTIITYIK